MGKEWDSPYTPILLISNYTVCSIEMHIVENWSYEIFYFPVLPSHFDYPPQLPYSK
jgi:hypothetical protein